MVGERAEDKMAWLEGFSSLRGYCCHPGLKVKGVTQGSGILTLHFLSCMKHTSTVFQQEAAVGSKRF